MEDEKRRKAREEKRLKIDKDATKEKNLLEGMLGGEWILHIYTGYLILYFVRGIQ